MVALIDADAPIWAQKFSLSLDQAYVGQFPTAPVKLWGVLQAKLPPAAKYPGCIVYVSDLGKVGLSNGTAWTQTDGGAL
jgi:hypothetical protein